MTAQNISLPTNGSIGNKCYKEVTCVCAPTLMGVVIKNMGFGDRNLGSRLPVISVLIRQVLLF